MLPLIFIGIVLGLLVLGKSFDFFSILGLLGLIGMNIKNAIVLVDQIDLETAAGKKPLMMIMRNAERNAQWRHTLQSGIETARVPLDELTPHAEKLAPLLAQWHQKGLSRDASTCLRLTNEGRFWASNILQSLNELIQVLNAPAIALEKP